MVTHIRVDLTCGIFFRTPEYWLPLAAATRLIERYVHASRHSAGLIWILHDHIDRLAIAGERLVERAFVDEVGFATDGLLMG